MHTRLLQKGFLKTNVGTENLYIEIKLMKTLTNKHFIEMS